MLAALLVALVAAAVGGPRLHAAEGPKLLSTSNREGLPKLYLVDPDSGATKPLDEPHGSESLAAWSPDGKKIAFCSSRSGNHDIWVMDADGSNPKQLTTDPAEDYVSSWSPDGKKIAFTTLRTGDEEIFVMNADGSDQHNLTNNPGFDGDPAWSPDGKAILFTSTRDGEPFRLYLMDPDGKNVHRFPGKKSSAGPVFPAWLADGKRIAFSDEDGQAIEIFVCDADGSNVKKITGLGGVNTFAAWSPDGKRIAFVHYLERGGDGSLCVVSVADPVQTILGQAGSYMSGRPSWKPTR